MQIDINNLKKKYGDKTVLDIENLTIQRGKITGIIGPNGCGKTTLINIISGIEDDFSGALRYNNQCMDKQVIENMTYVFQKPYLFKSSVYENIAYPLKLRNIKKDKRDELVLDIIKKLEIKDLTGKRADLLSGGESQKVALARALVFIPKLLLLDEPMSNIDPESIKIMEREIINFYKSKKATIVIVTHNLEQSKRLCHNIINLEHGKILE